MSAKCYICFNRWNLKVWWKAKFRSCWFTQRETRWICWRVDNQHSSVDVRPSSDQLRHDLLCHDSIQASAHGMQRIIALTMAPFNLLCSGLGHGTDLAACCHSWTETNTERTEADARFCVLRNSSSRQTTGKAMSDTELLQQGYKSHNSAVACLKCRGFQTALGAATSFWGFVHSSVAPQPLCWALAASYTQSVGLLGRGISQSQGMYLHTEQHKRRINAHRHPCLE
jgi:hypothetical protein